MGRVFISKRRRGLTLMETVIALSVLVLLGMMLMPMIDSTRSQMRGQSSAANLMAIGQGGMMYAGDNQNRLFSYTWRAGETYVMPDGRARITIDDRQAAAFQNQEILMRRTGRINGDFRIVNFGSRLPHFRFTHLVLMDYLGQAADTQAYIDPNDGKQLAWTANPLDYDLGSSVPYANIPDGYDFDHDWQSLYMRQRWAFTSSYQVVPDAWQQYAPGNRISRSRVRRTC